MDERLEIQTKIAREIESIDQMTVRVRPSCIDCGNGYDQLHIVVETARIGGSFRKTVFHKCVPCVETNGYAPIGNGDMIGEEI